MVTLIRSRPLLSFFVLACALSWLGWLNYILSDSGLGIIDEDVEALVPATSDLDEYVFGALEEGVAGFLLKDADPEVIAHALRQVAAGRGTIDQSLTRRSLREVAERRRLQPVVVWAYKNRVVELGE